MQSKIQVLENSVYKLTGSYYFVDNGLCCTVNCCSNYTGEDGTTVRRRPNEKIDKFR